MMLHATHLSTRLITLAFLLTWITTIIVPVTAQEDGGTGVTASCPQPDQFGANCTTCHCLNGVEACDRTSGYCTVDYQCDRGWTDPPFCQTQCTAVTWGVNCQKTCHCQAGDVCDPVNGVCNGSCDVEWAGPSCQIRRTRLTSPPAVDNVTCSELWLTWRAWSEELDTGDPSVASYSIHQKINGSAWVELTLIQVDDPMLDPLEVEIININPYSTYTFRIVANRMEYGKMMTGLPGPASPAVTPLVLCIEPTTILPPTTTTTPLTTTTSYITTTQPTTTTQATTTQITTTQRTTTEDVTTTTEAPTTTPIPNPPGPIINFRASLSDVLQGVLTLTWSPPTNLTVILTSYQLSYQIAGIGNCNDTYEEESVSRDIDSRLTSFEVVGLQPWRIYRVKMAAVNVAGAGLVVQQDVLSQAFQPVGVVSSITHTSLLSTSVGFTWDDVPCPERGGVLAYYSTLVVDGTTQEVISTQNVPTGNLVMVIGLTPYREYSIRVRYVNNIGAGPYSDEYSITTRQDTPPAPRNVRVLQVTDSSIVITWAPPVPPHGILVDYRIIYWSETEPDVENSVQQPTGEGATSRNVTNLIPFTSYSFQVQARTQVAVNGGWGNRSSPVVGATSDGIPGAPSSLMRSNRNQSCLTVTWDDPLLLNGQLTNFKLTYKIMAVLSGDAPDTGTTILTLAATVNTYQACSLLPAAQYRFEIFARTRKDYGPPKSADIWTEVAVPSPPPRPEVVFVDESTVTLRIQPVVLNGGPVSGYFIVVSAMEEEDDFRRRKRRSTLPDPVLTIPLSGYTAAELGRDSVTRERSFVVGDGQTYGDYTNKPLITNTDYDVYYVVASSLDDVTKMAFSHTATPVHTGKMTSSTSTSTQSTTTTSSTASTTTRKASTPIASSTPERVVTTEEPAPSTTAGVVIKTSNANVIIIGVVVGVAALLLIIALIILLLWCIRKNRESDKLPQDSKNTTWLSYYTDHFYNTPSLKQAKWSDINNLTEARHPTVFDQFSPTDIPVSDMHHNRPHISFEEEYRKLPQGMKFPCNVAQRSENADKNRFDHILAYDHSRVPLRDKASDYINANYVDGYDKRNAFISAQSPFNDVTMCDFWYMVYQEKVTQIVFLARLVEDGIVKSEMYWPAEGAQGYGIINVEHIRTVEYANFIVRTFELGIEGAESRRVTQYQYTVWPDHGVPDDPIPFLEFRMKVKTSINGGQESPIVVHCGTGVSRSAVFIATDSLLEQAKVENAVNVYNFCSRMRRNRTMMVRTVKQYVFIYDTLFEALITNYNIVGEDLKVNYRMLSNVNAVTDKSYFREQFEIMEKFIDIPTPEQCAVGSREQNAKKNRFSSTSLLPVDKYRPILHTPGGLGRTDYINAITVDSYLRSNAFIVTQTPLGSTVIDFWKLIYDYNIHTIVAMNGSDFQEETCVKYLPQRIGMKKCEPFFVGLASEIEEEHITVRTIKLTNAQKPSEPAREIRQFQFESWNMYDKVPWSRDGFMDLMDAVDDWQEESRTTERPILVHCMDGASQSGLFCASYVVCEKYRIEGEVDVFHSIKHMKLRRFHMVNTMEQYKFCFKLLWDYLHTRIKKAERRSRLSLVSGRSSQRLQLPNSGAREMNV